MLVETVRELGEEIADVAETQEHEEDHAGKEEQDFPD